MPPVEFACSNSIAVITLNRPERLNAVIPALVDGLLDAFERADSSQARVIVMAGNGRAFCAGYDLKEPEPVETPETTRARMQRLQDVTRRIIAFPGPVIAAVHGYALGAGAEFAFGSDIVIAGSDAVFGFPEVEVGLSVTGGLTYLLPRAVGLVRAKELILLGERFTAQRAFDLGLVSRVVPTGAHLEAALALAESLTARPPTSLRLAKRALDAGADGALAAAFDREVDDVMATLSTGENDVAAARFRERD